MCEHRRGNRDAYSAAGSVADDTENDPAVTYKLLESSKRCRSSRLYGYAMSWPWSQNSYWTFLPLPKPPSVSKEHVLWQSSLSFSLRFWIPFHIKKINSRQQKSQLLWLFTFKYKKLFCTCQTSVRSESTHLAT